MAVVAHRQCQQRDWNDAINEAITNGENKVLVQRTFSLGKMDHQQQQSSKSRVAKAVAVAVAAKAAAEAAAAAAAA